MPFTPHDPPPLPKLLREKLACTVWLMNVVVLVTTCMTYSKLVDAN